MKNVFLLLLIFIACSAQAQTAVKDKECNCYGFKDSQDNLIIECQYDYARGFFRRTGHSTTLMAAEFSLDDRSLPVAFLVILS